MAKKEKILTKRPADIPKAGPVQAPNLEYITKDTILNDGDQVLYIPNLGHIVPLLQKISQGIQGVIRTIDNPQKPGEKLQVVSTNMAFDLLAEGLKGVLSAKLPKIEVPDGPKEVVKPEPKKKSVN